MSLTLQNPQLVAIATALALACLPTAARADFATGNDLWNWFSSTDSWRRGLCLGYVTAIAEIVDDGGSVNPLCIPEQVTRQPNVDVVKRWLDQHPEQRQKHAEILVDVETMPLWPPT